MITVKITANNKTVMKELPMDYYDLAGEVYKLDLYGGMSKIKLDNSEDAKVRVTLSSDSDFGNHLIKLFKDYHNLADLYTATAAIENAPDFVKEELEEYILHDQLGSPDELYGTIRKMKEEFAPVVTKFYCPLLARIHDDEYGELEEIGDWAIKAARYEIEDALKAAQSPAEEMADYITDNPSVNEKLVSAEWLIEEINGTVYGKIECRSVLPFTPEEIEALRDGITGQNSDGFGEGFEQQPIKTNEGELFVSFWHSGDGYFVRTEEEMLSELQETPNNSKTMNLGGM